MSTSASPMKDRPRVKVFMITYQHEKYIEQAVRSVMTQRTDFPVTLVIGEDCSTDSTRAIVVRLAEEFAGRITLLLHKENLGVERTGLDVWEECLRDSDMIAKLEGDDLWTDESKLQRQVDVLLARPDCSLCFHNGHNLRERSGRQQDYIRGWLGDVPLKDTWTLEDLVQRNFIPTASILFRNSPELRFFERLKGRPIMDWTILVTLLGLGPAAYIDRHMCIRRVHPGGMISTKGVLHKIEMNLRLLLVIDEMTGQHFRERIEERRMQLLRDGLQHAVDNGDRTAAEGYWERLRVSPAFHPKGLERLRWRILVGAPAVARAIHRLRTGSST